MKQSTTTTTTILLFRVWVSATIVVQLLGFGSDAFVMVPRRTAGSFPSTTTSKTLLAAELGLLTFDLDDTLYPIQKVEQAANEAFVRAMARFGFDGLQPDDIVRAAKEIRAEMNRQDPAAAAALTHVQVRERAIRREMERVTTQRKLQSCADDWATPIESLSPLVVTNAKKYVYIGRSNKSRDMDAFLVLTLLFIFWKFSILESICLI